MSDFDEPAERDMSDDERYDPNDRVPTIDEADEARKWM